MTRSKDNATKDDWMTQTRYAFCQVFQPKEPVSMTQEAFEEESTISKHELRCALLDVRCSPTSVWAIQSANGSSRGMRVIGSYVYAQGLLVAALQWHSSEIWVDVLIEAVAKRIREWLSSCRSGD